MGDDDSTLQPADEPVDEPSAVNGMAFLRATQGTMLNQATPQLVDGTTTTANLPLGNTQVGNLFKDRSPNVLWYLPSYKLADDVDPQFGFAATQVGVDATGNPFDRALLTLGLKRVMPPDAAAHAASPGSLVTLREIPLLGVSATLTIVSNDPTTGDPKPATYTGVISGNSGDSLKIVFNTILGIAVIIAYENLMNGTATLAIAGSYQVMRPVIRPATTILHVHPPQHPPEAVAARAVDTTKPGPSHSDDPPSDSPPARLSTVTNVPHPEPLGPHPQPTGPTQPTQSYVQSTQRFGATIALAKKYAGPGYGLKYTVTSSGSTRAIATVDDLKSFNSRQSEFSEYTALGDISIKYPSFARLYIGQISRVVVAVPARYGIVRGMAGTAASCRAVLDPSGTSGACKFEFSFMLGPVISVIEMMQLTKDVLASAASHDCTVVLPKQLDPSGSSTVATAFQQSAVFGPGDRESCFSLAVEISDRGGAAVAVANTNLFIQQLVSTVQSFTGSLAIKLDDFYEKPITTGVVLSFSLTSGSDEIAFSIDPTTQAIQLSNLSPLDLQISRYATVVSDTVAVQPFDQSLPAKQSVALGNAPGGSAPGVLVERTLALETPFTKAAIARYLTLDVSDVQAVQYQLGILASGVDFAGRGIAGIDVAITLNDLPAMAVPGSSITALNTAANQTVALPILNALTTLAATVAFTVRFADATRAPLHFTLPNDFIDQPVLVLANSAIPDS